MFLSLVNQYKHMNWANQKLIKILWQDSVTLADAIKLISHIVSVEHIWLSRISGQDEIFAPWSKLTLPECQKCSASNCAEYLKIILHLNEERFHEPISYVLTNGQAMSSTRGDILGHVPIHGSHHRGQISRIISQNDIKPPTIDYLIYCMQTDG